MRPYRSGLLRGAAIAAAALAATTRRRRASLVGRVVVITGGSRGLGLEMARQFARAGARVALLGRDDQRES